MKAWIRRWGPAILMMGIIFAASSVPGENLPNLGRFDFDLKKGGHMLGYAMLAASYLRALAGEGISTRRHWVAAILLAGIYAVTDEFHQSFTPGRTATPVDVLIDTAGAAIGIFIYLRGVNLTGRLRNSRIAG